MTIWRQQRDSSMPTGFRMIIGTLICTFLVTHTWVQPTGYASDLEPVKGNFPLLVGGRIAQTHTNFTSIGRVFGMTFVKSSNTALKRRFQRIPPHEESDRPSEDSEHIFMAINEDLGKDVQTLGCYGKIINVDCKTASPLATILVDMGVAGIRKITLHPAKPDVKTTTISGAKISEFLVEDNHILSIAHASQKHRTGQLESYSIRLSNVCSEKRSPTVNQPLCTVLDAADVSNFKNK